jgi:hypothetical protein
MKKNIRYAGLAILLTLAFCGCGGLLYSQTAPEARDFHPQRIGVLPVDVGPYEEAEGVVDDIIAGELVKRKWFQSVTAAGTGRGGFESGEDSKKAVSEYLAKLKALSFSDAELSGRIGEMVQADALLIVRVDFWQYTTDSKDKFAKVGMGIDMVDAKSGKILWKASHHLMEDYWVMKPELPAIAKKLAAKMISEMPH